MVPNHTEGKVIWMLFGYGGKGGRILVKVAGRHMFMIPNLNNVSLEVTQHCRVFYNIYLRKLVLQFFYFATALGKYHF